jgi:hypothetical protein
MTRAEAVSLIEQYSAKVFRAIGRGRVPTREEALDRIYDLAFRIPAEASERKAMRWLGFIQGVTWMLGAWSIDELKAHSRDRRIP